MPMRSVPMHWGRRPSVAASTRLARSGSSRYAEQTSVLKSLGNQGDHIHQGLGRLATLGCQIADLLQGQDVTFIMRGSRLAHVLDSLVDSGSI